MAMELKHLNPQHVMDVTGKAIDEISRLRAENAELKAKLEDAKSTAYAESVDAGMRERKMKRALWLARAYRGYDNSILLPSKFMRKVWDSVERKCRAKAEEYK